MTIDQILSDLEDKAFCRSVTLQELTKMEQIILENDCTELLNDFSLRLEMDLNEDMEIVGGH
jgi:hypothetical protein